MIKINKEYIMKKIINGKVYDTDTARYVGSWENGCYQNDYNYVSEELYCKRTGEYFLYGEGGAGTKYSEMIGTNSWSSGEMIIPLTYDIARKWAEEHLKADDYLEEFEPMPDDNTKTNCTFYMGNGTIELLKDYARKQQKSMSECLENIIIDAVKK